MVISKITADDMEAMKDVSEKASCVLEWWVGFVRNIDRQGWISEKQRAKLKSFNYDREMAKAYSCSLRCKSKDWTAGLDHDHISDYTGEPCAAEFFS